MKKHFAFLTLFSLLFAAAPAEAAWIWSPTIGKWLNLKKTAKDTPEDQYAWAMEFFEKENWSRATEEFEKLPEVFPNSRLAAEGVYHVGLCWEKRGDDAKAADAYQKLIDKYPYSDRIKDAIKREFEIADRFFSGTKVKVLGVPALSGQEKALELYNHIVKNAPFGTYGDQAQFKIGEVYKAQAEYELAQKAFQAVVDEYPSSDLVAKARYQVAYVSMLASKRAHDGEPFAEKAIEEFEGFKNAFPQDAQAVEADESIKALRAEKAQSQYEVALFYEKRQKLASAKVYYQEVVERYPETAAAAEARKRLDGIVTRENEPARPKFRLW